MHKGLYEILGYASSRHMTTIVVANGSLLTEKSIRDLKQAGLSSLIISIDAAEASIHEANRKLPRVCERIQKANRFLRDAGIHSTASVTMSRLVDYDCLPGFLKDLGFDSVTFSYPLTTLNSSFLGFAESNLVDYTNDELIGIFDEIKALKRRGEIHVVNPLASMEEMQRHIRGEPEKFPCLGGYRYFYLDWNLDLWRCHNWDKPMCSIFDFDESKKVRDGCTRCMIDCYRDASVMQHIAVSITDMVGHIRKGHLIRATKSLFTKNNLISVQSSWADVGWIRKM